MINIQDKYFSYFIPQIDTCLLGRACHSFYEKSNNKIQKGFVPAFFPISLRADRSLSNKVSSRKNIQTLRTSSVPGKHDRYTPNKLWRLLGRQIRQFMNRSGHLFPQMVLNYVNCLFGLFNWNFCHLYLNYMQISDTVRILYFACRYKPLY